MDFALYYGLALKLLQRLYVMLRKLAGWVSSPRELIYWQWIFKVVLRHGSLPFGFSPTEANSFALAHMPLPGSYAAQLKMPTSVSSWLWNEISEPTAKINFPSYNFIFAGILSQHHFWKLIGEICFELVLQSLQEGYFVVVVFETGGNSFESKLQAFLQVMC